VLAGRWQESGQFCFFDHPIRGLAGARIGIIGEGVLGQRMADLARSFGMVPMFAAHTRHPPAPIREFAHFSVDQFGGGWTFGRVGFFHGFLGVQSSSPRLSSG
jgi:lactate dehydrogenase-like 2-hydroxyacid dehydrogenase